MNDATENACSQGEAACTSFDELPPCLVSTMYTLLPDAASRHALASTSKGVRAAVLHHISKLTVPKEQLCMSGSINNPLFTFPKNASLRTLVIEGHAGLEEHDDGPQLNELLLPQPEDTYRRALFAIMNLHELELKEVSISLEDHAVQLGVLVNSLPDLRVLRLTRIRSPPVVLCSFFLAFEVRDKANSSIRELHLEGADGCNLSPAFLSLPAMTQLQTLSLSHNIDAMMEPQPSLTVLSSLQQLQHLTVLGSWGWGGGPLQDISQRPLMRLLAQLPHLQSFESYYGPIPEVIAVLPPFLTSLHCMGELSINKEYTETLDDLTHVREAVSAQRLPHLRELFLKQVSLMPVQSEQWVDTARLIAQAMLSCPGVAISVKDVFLPDLEAFAVFCSIVPSVAEHIKFIEMTGAPHASSIVPLAQACPNLAGLSIQSEHPGVDLAWLHQTLTLFKGLRTVEFSDFPYGQTSPGELVASELPSVLRASADATKRTQPLEIKCSFTIDSVANDDEAFEQSMRQEIRALEESVRASCATIRDPQKRIDFKASVDIEVPDFGDYDDDYDEEVDFD